MRESGVEQRVIKTNAGSRGDSQIIVFELDAQRFALPLQAVERVERAVAITPLAEAPAAIAGVIDVRGTLLPVIALRRHWGFPDRPLMLSDQLLIAYGKRRVYALLVDAVLDVANCDATVIAEPDSLAAQTDSLCGAVRLDEGIVFIHDLDRFLSLDAERDLDKALING